MDERTAGSGERSSFDRKDRFDRPPRPERGDRLPPQNLEAEKGVLGSILLENHVLDDVADQLFPDHFYLDSHKRIYAAIQRLHESGTHGFDPVTVAEALDKTNELKEVGGYEYLHEILESVPHAAHAKYYAEIVRGKAIQRRLIYSCTDILKSAYDDTHSTEDLLDQAEQSIFQILEQQEATQKIELKDILLDAFDRIDERSKLQGAISGLSSGFRDLDSKTNGFQSSELIILAARPSMGKTAFVLNMAEAAADRCQAGVVIFSLEQSKLELAERFLCLRARMDMHKLRKGELSEDERDLLLRVSSELSEMPVYIDDQPGRSMSQIASISRRLKRKNNIRLVVIDYLQLIEPEDKRAPREQQIAAITRRLKFLAKELQLPVIALAQLNRGVELREDKRPRLADLRESGAIEQDADIVMFLHRPEMYDPEDRPGEAEVIVAKHRNGPTGMIRLGFKKQCMQFEDFVALEEPEGGYFGNSSHGGDGF
ncbi:MAG: replicative DNA helicase [Planctomycetaceae bacterium]|nr:replicative DNA helicase [Planctomycetaceae bacterium]